MAVPAVAGFGLAATYAAIGDEIDPSAITGAFAETAFPLVVGNALVFCRAGLGELVPGVLGIPAPAADAPQIRPELVLVPLLGATPAGVRLGQGKGFYDRALAALQAVSPVRTIGIAWDCQVVAHLPSDRWDVPLDYIATPTRLVDCRAFR